MAHDPEDPRGTVGAHPARHPEPAGGGGPAGRLVPLFALVLAVVIVLLLLNRCGGDDPGTTGATATTASPAPTSTADAGTVTADGATMVPLSGNADAPLATFAGQEATSMTVRVESVPADEGFWVGPSSSDRVWVQLATGGTESPVTVEAGDHVAFTGTVTKNAAGFADTVGVTDAEGRAQLDAQGYHITVPRSGVKLVP